MLGRRSIRIAVACFAACLAACASAALQQEPKAKQQQTPTNPPALGLGAQFIGWHGETALFSEETYRPEGASRTAYYAMDSQSRVTVIPKPRLDKPAGPAPGTILFADYTAARGEKPVVFRMEADSKEVEALQSAIQNWLDHGSGKAQSFPVVHAELTIALSDAGKQSTVWKQRRDLTATAGEGGYLYDPPRLRFATLSPTGSTLLVELVNGAGSEFIQIRLLSKKQL